MTHTERLAPAAKPASIIGEAPGPVPPVRRPFSAPTDIRLPCAAGRAELPAMPCCFIQAVCAARLQPLGVRPAQYRRPPSWSAFLPLPAASSGFLPAFFVFGPFSHPFRHEPSPPHRNPQRRLRRWSCPRLGLWCARGLPGTAGHQSGHPHGPRRQRGTGQTAGAQADAGRTGDAHGLDAGQSAGLCILARAADARAGHRPHPALAGGAAAAAPLGDGAGCQTRRRCPARGAGRSHPGRRRSRRYRPP